MRAALSRLAHSLGVEAGEGPVFAGGAATLFLIGWASVSLTNVSETLFLKRVGVDLLPVVFLANGVLLVGTTYLVSRLAARTTRPRLLLETFVGLAGMVILLWLLVLAKVHLGIVLLVIAAKQVDAIALIAFWIVLGGLLHGRQAKRLYAPMIAGGTLGRILGSFASGPIGSLFGIPALLPEAAIALGLAGVVAVGMRAAVPVRLAQLGNPRVAVPAPGGLQTLAPLWRESRLFRLLVLSVLLSGTLAPMLYFQFSYIVDVATRGSNAELRLLDLYAKLRGFINAGVLGMQLVGTSRLFRRIGVPLAATLSPLIYLVSFLGVSTRFDLRSGIGAVSGTTLQDHAIQEPAQRILVTLFPERIRALATSLIEGPAQRAGGALGNLLVVAALAVSTPAWVGFVALPITALWLAVAIALWRIYPTLLLEVATAGPPRSNGTGALAELIDPGTLRALRAALIGPDLRRCRAACDLALEAPPVYAVEALARAAREAAAPNRPVLLNALHRLLERGAATQRPVPRAARHLEALLADVGVLDPIARTHLVEAYVRLVPPPPPGSRGARVLAQLVNDPVASVRFASMLHLQRSGMPIAARDDLDDLLAAACRSDDTAVRHAALEALRAAMRPQDHDGSPEPPEQERWDRRVALIVARLDEPRDRLRAAQVLAELAAQHGARLASCARRVLACADDPDPRVRGAVLRFIGSLRIEEYINWSIDRLSSPDEREAAAAAAALRSMGSLATNRLLDAFYRGRFAVREAVLPILQDMPLDRGTLRALIDREVTGVQTTLLQRFGLRGGPVSDLVIQRLDERVGEGLHTTLLLLAALLHEDRIAALGHLFARSPDRRRRAALLEALEALLPPAERPRLLPLLDDSQSPALVRAVAHTLGRALPSFDEAARETLASGDLLARAFLAATLDVNTRARAGAAAGLAPDPELGDHGGAGHALRKDSMLKRVEILLLLRGLDLFARLTTRELNELAGVVSEATYPAGTVIVPEGVVDECLYVVVVGEIRVTLGDALVGYVKPGEFFGEMALFDGETRSATATAATRVRVLRLQRQDLLPLMGEQPGIAIAMCETLARRVRELLGGREGQRARAGGGE